MGIRRIYIESGLTEDGHVILEEITSDVATMADLLKDVIPESTLENFRACNREGEIMRSRIDMPMPTSLYANCPIVPNSKDDFILDNWEIDQEMDFDEEDDEEDDERELN